MHIINCTIHKDGIQGCLNLLFGSQCFSPLPLSFFCSLSPQSHPQYPTVQVMKAVADCDSSCSLSCNSLHPASSSCHKPVFLSPGPTHPLVPTVSPVSPLHIENLLVAPTPASLILSPSHTLDTVAPVSPRQPSPSPALPQGVKSEIWHPQSPAFVPTVPAHSLHAFTGQSQSKHLPSNGTSQPLIKVIIMAAMLLKCLQTGHVGNHFNVTNSTSESQ